MNAFRTCSVFIALDGNFVGSSSKVSTPSTLDFFGLSFALCYILAFNFEMVLCLHITFSLSFLSRSLSYRKEFRFLQKISPLAN
jgi:hypothetical protein